MSYAETTPASTRPNPQKRNLLIQSIKRAPWWLLAAILIILRLYLHFADDPVYQTLWNGVKEGISMTIFISTRAYGLALVMGLILALMRLSNNFFFYQISTLYVEIIRGIPSLVLLLYFALALAPKIVGWGNELGIWLVENDLDIGGKGTYLAELSNRDFKTEYKAIIALAISYSAFLSEVFRAGIQSVGVGQIEAARSIGLNRFQVLRLIVLPQAFRTILPPLGNDFIAMLKESSLASALGVKEVTRRGRDLGTATFRVFETWNIVALTYLVLTLALAVMVKVLEWHLDEKRHKPEWYRRLFRFISQLFSIETYQIMLENLMLRLRGTR